MHCVPTYADFISYKDIAAKDNEVSRSPAHVRTASAETAFQLKKLRRKLADLEESKSCAFSLVTQAKISMSGLCKATESRLQVKQGPSIPQDSDTSQSDLSSLSALIDPHDTLVEAPASAEKIAASVSSIEATKLLGRSSERTDVSAADEIMLDGKDDPLKAGFSSSDSSSRSRIPPGRPVNRANKARVNKPVSEPCKTTTHQVSCSTRNRGRQVD